MRVLMIGLSLLSAVLFSAPATANELKPLMEQIGKDFKTTFQSAARGMNSDVEKEVVARLKDNITKAMDVLPEGISPDDAELVARYRGLMGMLLEKTVLLEDAFGTNPMDRPSALALLKEMDALRKRGHGIFR